jgi:CRP-like cAMP-binding protein
VGERESKAGLLKQVPFFSECSSSELEAVSQTLTEVEVVDGTAVVREGDDTREFYVIVSGTADVSQGGQPMRSLGPGDFFGEIASLFGARRTATVTATSTLQLLVSDEPGFCQLIQGTQGLHRKVIDALAQRLAPTAL